MNENWSIVYETAIDEDGNLFFPEKLHHEFLSEARQKMGTYLFANQYLNEVFAAEDAKFKKEWFKYYDTVPAHCVQFAYIDPAISTEDGADYTGIVVISVDSDMNWYFRMAERRRLNPTEIVNLCFELHREFKLMALGIESVAYQKALIYMCHEQMRQRQIMIPIKDVNPGTQSTKEMRILKLVPRFEFGKAFMKQGMHDFERELLQFPRAKNDDIADAASSLDNIVFYPTPYKEKPIEQPHPHTPAYEQKVIRDLIQRANDDGGY